MTRGLADLPPELERRFQAYAAAGRDAWRERGDIDGAEHDFLRAWNVIPDPKTEWDWSGSFVGGLLTFFIETGQAQKALAWLPEYEKHYGDTADLHVWQGIVRFELGQHHAAFEAFQRVHDAYGYRAFRDEDPKYWQFYRERSQHRGS